MDEFNKMGIYLNNINKMFRTPIDIIKYIRKDAEYTSIYNTYISAFSKNEIFNRVSVYRCYCV